MNFLVHPPELDVRTLFDLHWDRGTPFAWKFSWEEEPLRLSVEVTRSDQDRLADQLIGAGGRWRDARGECH